MAILLCSYTLLTRMFACRLVRQFVGGFSISTRISNQDEKLSGTSTWVCLAHCWRMVFRRIQRLRCYYWALDRCRLVSAVRNSWFQALSYSPYGGHNAHNTDGHNYRLGFVASLRAATTDNASDMKAGIKGLREKLNDLSSGQHPEVEEFHVRCLAYITNLAVKSCMGEVHDKIKKNKNAFIGNEFKYEKKRSIWQVQKGIRF